MHAMHGRCCNRLGCAGMLPVFAAWQPALILCAAHMHTHVSDMSRLPHIRNRTLVVLPCECIINPSAGHIQTRGISLGSQCTKVSAGLSYSFQQDVSTSLTSVLIMQQDVSTIHGNQVQLPARSHGAEPSISPARPRGTSLACDNCCAVLCCPVYLRGPHRLMKSPASIHSGVSLVVISQTHW